MFQCTQGMLNVFFLGRRLLVAEQTKLSSMGESQKTSTSFFLTQVTTSSCASSQLMMGTCSSILHRHPVVGVRERNVPHVSGVICCFRFSASAFYLTFCFWSEHVHGNMSISISGTDQGAPPSFMKAIPSSLQKSPRGRKMVLNSYFLWLVLS